MGVFSFYRLSTSMITASMTKDGSVVLAIYGNDIEAANAISKTLKTVDAGTSTNFKNGRKKRVLKLEPTDADEQIKKLTDEINATKRELIKAKSSVKTLTTANKKLKTELTKAQPEKEEEGEK